MIFSKLSMLYFWTFCFFANVSAQQLASTLPPSGYTCQGARIVFNCSITGSDSVTNLIIGWSSPKYIGQGSFLLFTTDHMVGDSVTSMINANVTAQLLYNGARNGIPTLESQLQLTVSSDSLNSTVSCDNVIGGTLRSVTLYIPNVPGRPHNAKGTEDLRTDGRCVIFLTWDTPLDYDEKHIDHYIVQIPSENTYIQTNAKSTFVSKSIPQCIPDIHINVSAVDRCGRVGPSTVIVPHLDLTTVNETARPTEQITTGKETQSGLLEAAVIALSVILGIVVMIIICVGLYVVCYCCYINHRKPDIVPAGYSHKTKAIKSTGEPNNDESVTRFKGRDINKTIVDVDTTKPAKHQLTAHTHKVEEVISLGKLPSSNTPFAIKYITVQATDPESEQLLTLCKDGCTAKVGDFISLLDQGVDPNIQDEDGYHPLWYASRYGKRELVELFLHYKADVNLKSNDGMTALHCASSSGHTDVVKLLVDSGAEIDNKDKDGMTALHCASSSGHTDVVKLLVDSGAEIDNKDKDGQTALHRASYKGHPDVVEVLVDSSAQIIGNKNSYGWTALHFASDGGHTNVVKLLVDSHAQIDKRDRDGQTALHLASHSGYAGVVKLLVGSGAQIDNKDKNGKTALHLASFGGHTDVVKLLVVSGAKIDSKDNNDQTALHLASDSGHTGAVNLLVDSHAQIDNKDKDGQTALHLASNSGHTDVVKLLVGSGAQIDNKDKPHEYEHVF